MLLLRVPSVRSFKIIVNGVQIKQWCFKSDWLGKYSFLTHPDMILYGELFLISLDRDVSEKNTHFAIWKYGYLSVLS